MTKAFSLASWNVEHFRNPGSRVNRIVQFLTNLPSLDVFALYEVEGAEVFEELVSKMPGYSFHITEGPQVQEILVGVQPELTAFFTQKVEFKTGIQFLRPGALLTLTVDSVEYPILFMHTKSGADPLGLGLRDDMFRRAIEFKKVLDKAASGVANYMFLGDLNTMGMDYTYLRARDIDGDQEIFKLGTFANRRGMRLLEKDELVTWWGGSSSSLAPSNLDQVVTASHMDLRTFGSADVTVLGWPKETTVAAKDRWIKDYSDHGCLYMEVQKVG